MHKVSIPDEFALVAACCRWPLTADVVAEVRLRSKRAIDWNYFTRIVKRHRVAGLVHHALQAARLSGPVDGWTGLTAKGHAIASQNLALAGETVRLQQRFDAAGIPVLTLKGLSLAQRVYGTIALKHGRDIDLLVAPDRAFAALQLLEDDGYLLLQPAAELSDQQRHAFIARGHELEVVHAKGARVELHWRLSENLHLTRGIDGFPHSQTVSLPGGAVRTLGDADLFAYLCVHGANHLWFRLKWLADLHALLGRAGEDEIECWYRHAQACGAGLCAAQALSLCEAVFGGQLPSALAQDLPRDRRVRWLCNIALQEMTGPDPAAEPSHATPKQAKETAYRFLLGRRARFFAAQLGIALVAPADVLAWQLPRRLWFLYPLIRLPSWFRRRMSAPLPKRPTRCVSAK